MKIALIGYGKMGIAIEEIAVAKGHEIILKIHIDNITEFTKEAIQQMLLLNLLASQCF
jgi:4-hydroxy-tetrahydrodipicolinate reductase